MTAFAMATRTPWQDSAERAARRLAICTAAGAVSGLLIGGIGGRFAMFVLAQANPAVTGVKSDDGFVMGQFTMSGTLNLLVVGTLLGVLGGGVYFVLRGLMIGPRWFQILSISGGGAVVVGSMLVHTDGVDFTLLTPPLVPIALFVAIPGLYVALLTVMAEHWLAPDGWMASHRRSLIALVLWLPLAPLLLVLVVGWALGALLRQTEPGREVLGSSALAWAARFALSGIFLERLLALTRDVTELS